MVARTGCGVCGQGGTGRGSQSAAWVVREGGRQRFDRWSGCEERESTVRTGCGEVVGEGGR